MDILLSTAANKSQWLQPAVIAALIAALVTLPGIIMNVRSFRLNRIQSRRKEIYAKLNDFYGPMRMLLKSSKDFSDLLKKDKDHLKGASETEFRVLTYLMRGKSFDKTDSTLLNKIISDGKKIEKIIIENAGLIDDEGLHKELNQLLTHIRLIRLANAKEFDFGAKKDKLLKEKVFPRIVSDVINLNFLELKFTLDKLNKNLNKKESKERQGEINKLKQEIEIERNKISNQ